MKKLFFLLMLLLPMSALAVQEGVIEEAPSVSVTVSMSQSVGVSHPSPELEVRAKDIIEKVFGHQDLSLLSSQKKWYIPASFDENGVAIFDSKEREGVEVTFFREVEETKLSYSADVLFDFETGDVIRTGVTYDFSHTDPLIPAEKRRVSDNDFGLRMGQIMADTYLEAWDKSTEMIISPKSDALYCVSHGMVDENWRFEFTVNRETGNAVRHEFLKAGK